MAQTTTTTLATTIPTELITDRIQEEARPFNIVAPLVLNDTQPQGQGSVWVMNKLPTTSAAAVAEASDITAAARTTTDASITVSEVGLGTALTYLAEETSRMSSQLVKWAASQGRAVAQKVTGDLCALFAALNSGSTVGSTGVNITAANFLEAWYTVLNANAPGLPRCVLHPRQVIDLFNALSASTGTPYGSLAELVREGKLPGGLPTAGFVGELYGIPIYQTTEVDTANSGADRVGAMFVESALGIITLRPITTEYDKDISARETEIITTCAYGVGELNDTYGVSITTDA